VHHKLEDQATIDLGFSLGYTSALETTTTHIDFLRRHDVDEFLDTLSYHELLGFLPMFVEYYVQIPQFSSIPNPTRQGGIHAQVVLLTLHQRYHAQIGNGTCQ
jgi:hypothetical protein